MSDSTNTALVRRLYDSGMAPDVVAQIIAEDLVWDITPGAPYRGVYHGWPSVGAADQMPDTVAMVASCPVTELVGDVLKQC